MNAHARTSAAILRLPRHARAASQARHTVAALAASHDQDVADRGQLLVTEAVANAVEHTIGTQVTVELAVDGSTGTMYCAVFDTDPRARLPEPRIVAELPPWDEKAEIAESGRGLDLIRALSDEWGCEREEDGKWVWFQLRPAA
ncbi:ATP-binding protein [Streptacidiphilus rugosus]|uniref:ATP-binding protein n=1 Tax=Streptacidiphilus rugosus TaxID=405783 RepID=UPI00068FB7F4|nr:ATP-binding protein [Streptacidiphilus rugosus]